MISNKVQLITYPDSLWTNLKELKLVLDKKFEWKIQAVHILPYYPSSSDRGFSPITQLSVDPNFWDRQDIKSISQNYELVSDLMVNHISSQSKEFQDFLQNWDNSKYSDWFMTWEKFSKRINLRFKSKIYNSILDWLWKITNNLRKLDFIFHKDWINRFSLRKIYRPRPGSPFVKFKVKNKKYKNIWCTFSSDQIDIDTDNTDVKNYLKNSIENLANNWVKLLRLDAFWYTGKKRWTNNFLTNKSYEFLAELIKICKENWIKTLPEIHNHYLIQNEIANVDWVDYVYDFALPMLTLYSLYFEDNKYLSKWLSIRTNNCITTLDTHDGIWVVDVEDIMSKKDIDKTIANLHTMWWNDSKRASWANAENVDIYQINCTYYSAVWEDDNSYITARAIQFFIPGIPQVYYVWLLAGKNDMEKLEITNVWRDINRHNYSLEEIDEHIQKDVVKRLFKLIEFRDNYPAFNWDFEELDSESNEIKLKRSYKDYYCILHSDLKKKKSIITYYNDDSWKEEKIEL